MSKTILIIDDNDPERDIFASFLRFAGGRVVEARQGEEGVQMALTHRPALILLDITMPVLDGWGTIERLKADPTTRQIPVVALTAHHLEWARLQEAGFDGYLEKPIVPFRVLEEVERFVGGVVASDRIRPASSPGRSADREDRSRRLLRREG
jgi:two-component system, cell cycle response regulator DivK